MRKFWDRNMNIACTGLHTWHIELLQWQGTRDYAAIWEFEPPSLGLITRCLTDELVGTVCKQAENFNWVINGIDGHQITADSDLDWSTQTRWVRDGPLGLIQRCCVATRVICQLLQVPHPDEAVGKSSREKLGRGLTVESDWEALRTGKTMLLLNRLKYFGLEDSDYFVTILINFITQNVRV